MSKKQEGFNVYFVAAQFFYVATPHAWLQLKIMCVCGFVLLM
jgi:hypothetical protein